MRDIKFRAWDTVNKKMLNDPYRAIATERINDMFCDEWEWLQYTGLKDKNGEEIYEGDIVEYKFIKYDVIFGDGKWLIRDLKFPYGVRYLYSCTEIKRIGNIYEPPELLENNNEKRT
jgi:uncharacterized phage protein (TIGR01671 family)